MRHAPTSTRIELALGGSVIRALRDAGADAIVVPSQLSAATSPNMAAAPQTVVTAWGTSSVTTLEVEPRDYPATFAGAPTRGVRAPLPEGRMGVTLNGAADYLTLSGRVSQFRTQVLTWSPLTGVLAGLSLVIVFKGGNAGEPLLCRSGATTSAEYGLFTDALEMVGTRAGTGLTFDDTSDPENWVVLIVSLTASTNKVWKNGESVTLAGSISKGGKFCPASDSQTLYIGRNVAGTDFFTGSIALAAVIPNSITDEEAAAIYAATQWTDVTADVAGWAPIECEYGLPGDRPDDVVARTGDLALTLKNGNTNRARTLGYYTPGHADCVSGFRVGIPIRFSLGYFDRTFYKFRGRVDAIEPAAGLYGARDTRIRAVDWLEEPATSPLPRLGTETAMRFDEALALIFDAMAQPPAMVDLDVGRDEFPYVFDAASSSNSPAIGEISRLVRSERGYFYPVGDEDGGGTIRAENRHRRALTDTIGATLDGTMYELVAARARRDIVTTVTVTIHPRRIDPAATTVLYALDEAIAPRIGPGETIQWRAGYRDPNSPIARIGGTNLVPPASGTDYSMNAAEDGSGADITASMTVEFQHAGIYGIFTITNGTNSDAYVHTLQIRGKGLYQYADLLCKSESEDGLVEYGENHIALDMAYQTDPNVAQGVADWVRAIWSEEATGVSRLSFLANTSEALMLAALTVEPGHAVRVAEAVTGIEYGDLANYYVHRVRYSLSDGDILRVTWTLAPADREQFAVLDDVGRAELDSTARIAYA